MRYYTSSKQHTAVNPDWISQSFNKTLKDTNIASFVYITKRKNVGVIYKPTPILDDDGIIIGIIGNAYNEGSSPAIIKIHFDKIGYYGAIRSAGTINEQEYCPESTLTGNIVDGIIWEESAKKGQLVFCAIHTLAPIPFGTNITSLEFDEDFLIEMREISNAHAFWSNTMVDVIEQYNLDDEVISPQS
jgi:hypothetical protein